MSRFTKTNSISWSGKYFRTPCMSDVQLKYWLLLFFFYFYFWHLWRYNFATCFLPMIETTKYKEYIEQKDFWKCHFVRSYNLFYFNMFIMWNFPMRARVCPSSVGRSVDLRSVIISHKKGGKFPILAPIVLALVIYTVRSLFIKEKCRVILAYWNLDDFLEN